MLGTSGFVDEVMFSLNGPLARHMYSSWRGDSVIAETSLLH